MTAYLLDVNVLVALLWRPHAQHQAAMVWFAANASLGWATCPMTEAGFVRVVSNPAANPTAPAPEETLNLLGATTKRNQHHSFWADELPLTGIGQNLRKRIRGHQQITDAYLLALAIHHKSRFVTFDRGVQSLAPPGSAEQAALLVLES